MYSYVVDFDKNERDIEKCLSVNFGDPIEIALSTKSLC